MTASLTWNDVLRYSRSYRVNLEDVILIALNAFGARSEDSHQRARLNLRFSDRPDDPMRLGIPLARAASPFGVHDGQLWLDSTPIAEVSNIEDDDAHLGYFRKRGRVLTLNSNARSHCTGCVFCPNSLEPASDPRLALLDDLDLCLSMFELEHGWSDLSHLEELTLVSGCFQSELPAVEHLEMVRAALGRHRSEAKVGFLTSVIRSPDALERIAKNVAPFALIVTLECFTNRDTLLKKSKAELSPDEVPQILATARSCGHDTGFTYIVGLDPLAEVIGRIEELTRHCTRFPNFQIFQAHNDFMAGFAAPGADHVEFFLDARARLEQLLVDTPLRPLTWANYRTLWFFTFAGEELDGARM